MIVYRILNRVNGKMYIGQSAKKLGKRFKAHIDKLNTFCHENKHLERAWHKYKPHNFTFEVLEEAQSREELNFLEIYYIKFYDSVKNGYNKTHGGQYFCQSEEVKKKMSEKMKAKFASGEKTVYNQGMKLPEDWCESISKALKDFHKNNVSPLQGRKHSPEQKATYSGKNHFCYGKFGKDNRSSKKFVATSPEGVDVCFYSQSDFARLVNINRSNIPTALKGKCKSLKGWTNFKYV